MAFVGTDDGTTVGAREQQEERWLQWECELARRGIRVTATMELIPVVIAEPDAPEVAYDYAEGVLETAPSLNTPFSRYLKDVEMDTRTPRERLEEYLSRHGVRPRDVRKAA